VDPAKNIVRRGLRILDVRTIIFVPFMKWQSNILVGIPGQLGRLFLFCAPRTLPIAYLIACVRAHLDCPKPLTALVGESLHKSIHLVVMAAARKFQELTPSAP
jgi:hypothetical protein